MSYEDFKQKFWTKPKIQSVPTWLWSHYIRRPAKNPKRLTRKIHPPSSQLSLATVATWFVSHRHFWIDAPVYKEGEVSEAIGDNPATHTFILKPVELKPYAFFKSYLR